MKFSESENQSLVALNWGKLFTLESFICCRDGVSSISSRSSESSCRLDWAWMVETCFVSAIGSVLTSGSFCFMLASCLPLPIRPKKPAVTCLLAF